MIELDIDNLSPHDHIIQVWQDYTGDKSNSKVNPPLFLKPMSRTSTRIIYPTPKIEGIHHFQLKLLNKDGNELHNQSFELEVDVKQTSKQKH